MLWLKLILIEWFKKLLLYLLGLIYGLEFERGYKYKLVSCKNLSMFELNDSLLVKTGWVKHSDLFTGINTVKCWYKLKK